MEQTTLILSATPPAGLYWKDLWRYRNLLFFLGWRDLLLRYKQTFLGVAWAVFPAIATAGIFSIVFGRFAKLPTGGVPYPLFVLAATLPWNLFASGLSQSGSSLVSNAHLISKVYFPRLVIPLSAVLVSLVDIALSAVLMIGLMAWYHVAPGRYIFFIIPCLVVALMSTIGVGVWVAALQVRYRDFRYLIPLLLQLGLYVSPVGFSSDIVPTRWRILYSCNPMVGIIDGFRFALLGGTQRLFVPACIASLVVSALLLFSGLRYFRNTENIFADVI
jgi:lipopolysaccharide transport system permease protein